MADVIKDGRYICIVNNDADEIISPVDMVGYTMVSLYEKQEKYFNEKMSFSEKEELEHQMKLQSELLNSLANGLSALER